MEIKINNKIFNSPLFSDSCGYSNKFNELAQTIKESIPSAEVNGKEGRTGKWIVPPKYFQLLFFLPIILYCISRFL